MTQRRAQRGAHSRDVMAKRRRSQLNLPIDARHQQPDRNAALGGRSFYFFDFDDNVLHVPTEIFVFNRDTGEERAMSTEEFARVAPGLGKPGRWERWGIDYDDDTGSFRRFRDHEGSPGATQPFVEDVARALERPPVEWMGPSWQLFDYAVHNQRPLAIVTARGHDAETIRAGVELLVGGGYLSRAPNYLCVYPVSQPKTRMELGLADGDPDIPRLKKAAIVRSVERAMVEYGDSPHHRFGMSDDDPRNVALVIEAMTELKRRYPGNAFFVFDTGGEGIVRNEVFSDHVETESASKDDQLELFE